MAFNSLCEILLQVLDYFPKGDVSFNSLCEIQQLSEAEKGGWVKSAFNSLCEILSAMVMVAVSGLSSSFNSLCEIRYHGYPSLDFNKVYSFQFSM